MLPPHLGSRPQGTLGLGLRSSFSKCYSALDPSQWGGAASILVALFFSVESLRKHSGGLERWPGG